MIPIVTFVGRPGAGKTTMIEKLVAEFKTRGGKVAAVKHTHELVETDTPGKDSWRFTRAGSAASILISPVGMTVFRDFEQEPDLRDVVAMLGDEYDIVIAEGFKQSKYPKIEVMGDGQPALICNVEELCAVISDDKPRLNVPVFSRNDITQIADFINKEIVEKSPPGMEIRVNGRAIFMKPFVRDIIGSSILAMLASLKTIGIIRSATIRIRNKL